MNGHRENAIEDEVVVARDPTEPAVPARLAPSDPPIAFGQGLTHAGRWVCGAAPAPQQWRVSRRAQERTVADRLLHASTIVVQGPLRIGKSTFVRSSLENLTNQRGCSSLEVDIAVLARAYLRGEANLVATFANKVGNSAGIGQFMPGAPWDLRLTKWMEERVLLSNITVTCLVIDGALDFFDGQERRVQKFYRLFVDMLRRWYSWMLYPRTLVQERWRMLRIVLVDPFWLGGPLDPHAVEPSFGEAPIRLKEFDDDEVRIFAGLYGLGDRADEILSRLKPHLGGHPYLLCVALNAMRDGQSIEDIVVDATTNLQYGVFHGVFYWLENALKGIRHGRGLLRGPYGQLLRKACRARVAPASVVARVAAWLARVLASIRRLASGGRVGGARPLPELSRDGGELGTIDTSSSLETERNAESLARAGILKRVGAYRYCVACGLFKTYLESMKPWT